MSSPDTAVLEFIEFEEEPIGNVLLKWSAWCILILVFLITCLFIMEKNSSAKIEGLSLEKLAEELQLPKKELDRSIGLYGIYRPNPEYDIFSDGGDQNMF